MRPGTLLERARSTIGFSRRRRFLDVRYFLTFTGLLASALAGICATAALADGTDTLKNALIMTMKQTSYHITMVTPGQGTTTGDVINPGRMHMTMKDAEIIVIDKTMYMKQGGSWTKVPGVDIMQTDSDPLKAFAAKIADYTVDDLGMKVIDGASLHAYRTTRPKEHYVSTIYIDSSGRIVRIESGTMSFTMSNFGESVSIVAPM